jgi:hypothetical protein
MGIKQDSVSRKGEGEPVEVFRQFAWHLAGSLASAQATQATKPRPAKGTAKR